MPAASGAVHQQNPPDAVRNFSSTAAVLYRGIQYGPSLSDSLTLIAENFLQCPCIESNYRGRMQITPDHRSRSGSAAWQKAQR
ncbi:hypothetical protein ECZU51_59040 [Escherichia coli]|nr:hypothetical protein ECZU51_59040 [Escherichia coli]